METHTPTTTRGETPEATVSVPKEHPAVLVDPLCLSTPDSYQFLLDVKVGPQYPGFGGGDRFTTTITDRPEPINDTRSVTDVLYPRQGSGHHLYKRKRISRSSGGIKLLSRGKRNPFVRVRYMEVFLTRVGSLGRSTDLNR